MQKSFIREPGDFPGIRNGGLMKGHSLRYRRPKASCKGYHTRTSLAAWAPCRPSPLLDGMRSLRPGGTPGGNLSLKKTSQHKPILSSKVSKLTMMQVKLIWVSIRGHMIWNDIHTGHLVFFFPFHPSILKPDFDLSFG